MTSPPPDPVRVDVVRSGGFAGMSVSGSVDTASLPPAEAEEVTRLVSGLDLPALAAGPSLAPARGADRFQYDVTISRGPDSSFLSLPESAVPESLRPLLSLVLRHGRT